MEEIGLNATPRNAYWALSSQLAMSQPTLTRADEYSPSITSTPCTDVTIKGGVDTYPEALTGELKLSLSLPTKSNPRLCSCMMQTLNCIANPIATMEEKIVSLRNLCPQDKKNPSCAGVSSDYTEGQFGSFMLCNYTERASWMQHQNYIAQGNDSAACISGGGALQQATPLTSLPGDCQILLRQAGPNGTGTVTYDPSTNSTESASSFSRPNKSSLKPGAMAGIGVGISILVIVLSITGAYCCWRKRRGKGSLSSNGRVEDEYHKAELPDTTIPRDAMVETLLDSKEVAELAGSDARKELTSEGQLVEVHGCDVVELPTADNELVELEAHSLKGK